MWSRALGALFVAYVVATAVHIGFVVAHEPFSFDAWNVAVDTDAKPITFGRFFDYWQYQYAHSNPRLGQPLTYLSYKVSGFAEIATPLAFVGLTLAITVLGLGRFPRRGRDLGLWAIAIGFCWFALPHIGRNMFCRSYAANYIYTAAIQLWFLVPLRLASVRGEEEASREEYIAYGMAGALAGICNEHTGPALITFLVGYAWWLRRAGKTPARPLAGALGVALGFCALVLAPGQSERYSGLAQKGGGLVERVLDRGVSGAADIVAEYLVYAVPLLALLVVVFALGAERSRRAPPLILLALGAGIVVAVTLLASPKLGARFFIAPLAVLLAGFIALVDETMTSRPRLVPLVALAVIASVFAAAKTVPLFRTISTQGEARMAALTAAAPGSSLAVAPWKQVGESWWFIGDDFRDPKKRAMVARYFGLTKVTLKGERARGRD